MVVDHADRLHERVDDGRADEFEAAVQRVLSIFFATATFRPAPAASCGNCFAVGLPSRWSHRKFEKPGPLSMISSQARADDDRALDLGAVAHDAGVLHQPLDLALRDSARFFPASKSSKARRKLSRLRRMVIHDSPAWKPSSTSFSKSARSSNSGTPHSSS